ncbi:MAG: DUF4013 domain-containing protein [Haloferacaceae archaeon]
MIRDSLDYLRESDDALKTVVIGGVLMAFSWLLVPLFLVMGYVVRVLRRTAAGNDDAPVFDDWEELAVTGAKAFVIQFAYGLVPAVLAAAFVFFGVLGAASGTDSGAALGGVVAVVGLLVAFVLGGVAAYLTPAAIANFAEKGTLGAGFAVGELRPVWTSGVYAKAWLTGVAVVVGAGVVGGIVGVVPVLGQILVAFVTFYALVAAYYIVGHAWGDLSGIELRGDDESPEERPAV